MRYNFTGFYGSYGHILEHNDGTAYVEIIWNGYIPTEPYRKTYKNIKGAKIALGRMLEIYHITDIFEKRGNEYVKIHQTQKV